MQWVASTLHTTSEHGVSSITTADAAHLYCQQSTELTPTGRFKWTRPFRAKDEISFLRVCHHISIVLSPKYLKMVIHILHVDAMKICTARLMEFCPITDKLTCQMVLKCTVIYILIGLSVFVMSRRLTEVTNSPAFIVTDFLVGRLRP